MRDFTLYLVDPAQAEPAVAWIGADSDAKARSLAQQWLGLADDLLWIEVHEDGQPSFIVDRMDAA
jgi:hypothetical protein